MLKPAALNINMEVEFQKGSVNQHVEASDDQFTGTGASWASYSMQRDSALDEIATRPQTRVSAHAFLPRKMEKGLDERAPFERHFS